MRRLLVVQYAGDYRAAYRLLQATGTETYYGHRHVLERLETMGREFGAAGVLCCRAPERYVETLPSGVVTMGANMRPGLQSRAILRMVEDFAPTHLVVHGPMPHILRWGTHRGISTMAMFADSFDTRSLTQRIKRRIKHGWIERQLNGVAVDLVGNHGLNACLSLARLGIDRGKIIPWDWPHDHDPELHPAKRLGDASAPPVLFYVGYLSQAKGVGDAIAAVAALKQRGRRVLLRIAGGGDRRTFEKQVQQFGVANEVEFLGLIPNAQVLDTMRQAQVVLVPSRHEFPEGLPLTIYEALRSRTPIVASDHPMFAHNLVDGESASIFPASDPARMADCIEKLLSDDDRYARLSLNSAAAWRRIQIEAKWGDILEHWLRGDADDREWLTRHRLNSPLYADRLRKR